MGIQAKQSDLNAADKRKPVDSSTRIPVAALKKKDIWGKSSSKQTPFLSGFTPENFCLALQGFRKNNKTGLLPRNDLYDGLKDHRNTYRNTRHTTYVLLNMLVATFTNKTRNGKLILIVHFI